MNELEFRIATLKDLNRIAEISCSQEIQYLKQDKIKFAKIIKEKRILIVKKDKNIIGFMYWQENFLDKSYFWYATQITIDLDVRKQGIGHKLMKYFLKHAKSKKIKKIFATIHTDNKKSLGLAKKIGFKNSGYIEGMNKTKDNEKRKILRYDL